MRITWMFAAMSLVGCVVTPVLVPAPGISRSGTQATVETAGVRVWVDGAAWRGAPGDLSRYVTPIHVVIDNRSGHALRVAYEAFSLETGDGLLLRPLAPLPGAE